MKRPLLLTRGRRVGGSVLVGLALSLLLAVMAYADSGPSGRPGTEYGRLPLSFTANQGQEDPQVRFSTRGSGYALYFTPEGATMVLTPGSPASPGKTGSGQRPEKKLTPPAVVRLAPVGLSPETVIKPLAPLPGRVNYFRGQDPQNWRTDIPTYGAVLYPEAFPGIDLKFYGQERRLEYDLIVKPGADPGRAKMSYDGIRSLELNSAGDLVIHLPQGGSLVQPKPVVYQEIAGKKVDRAGKFRIEKNTGPFIYGFDVAAYDARYPLIIDPVIMYSTFLGGRGNESGEAIAVNGVGEAFIVGHTDSLNFPIRNPFQGAPTGQGDVFVTKLNAAGNALVYSTFIGGHGKDEGTGIKVDAAGNAYITGFTTSLDFPVVNPIQRFPQGSADVFVTKLNPNGNALVFSTCLGGNGNDLASAIAIDPGLANPNIYVTGRTSSLNFPKALAFQSILRDTTDAFVTKLTPVNALGNSFRLGFSTYLGGSKLDFATAIAVDGLGQVFVTGATVSIDFPVLNAFQSSHTSNGGTNAFVTKFNRTGRTLLYSTFLGGFGLPAGPQEPANYVDVAHGIAIDNLGNAYVVGETRSPNFPLRFPFQGFPQGGVDAFVTKLNNQGNGLVFSTYLGGAQDDFAFAIALDNLRNPHVTGATQSLNFPIRNIFQGFFTDSAFVTKLTNTGANLVYSSFLGGTGSDQGLGIAVDLAGNAYVTGETSSLNFPVRNAFQPTFGQGQTDAFVTKISR